AVGAGGRLRDGDAQAGGHHGSRLDVVDGDGGGVADDEDVFGGDADLGRGRPDPLDADGRVLPADRGLGGLRGEAVVGQRRRCQRRRRRNDRRRRGGRRDRRGRGRRRRDRNRPGRQRGRGGGRRGGQLCREARHGHGSGTGAGDVFALERG